MSAPAESDHVQGRPYRLEDRTAVRDVCYRTGYMGRPIDWQWFDAESFARAIFAPAGE